MLQCFIFVLSLFTIMCGLLRINIVLYGLFMVLFSILWLLLWSCMAFYSLVWPFYGPIWPFMANYLFDWTWTKKKYVKQKFCCFDLIIVRLICSRDVEIWPFYDYYNNCKRCSNVYIKVMKSITMHICPVVYLRKNQLSTKYVRKQDWKLFSLHALTKILKNQWTSMMNSIYY